MTMLLSSFGQLAACIAYLLLAYAFFLVWERHASLDAKVAAIAFAYCGIAVFAQFAAIVGHLIFPASDLYQLMGSTPFQLLFNAPRPWAHLLAAICVLRIARSISTPPVLER